MVEKIGSNVLNPPKIKRERIKKYANSLSKDERNLIRLLHSKEGVISIYDKPKEVSLTEIPQKYETALPNLEQKGLVKVSKGKVELNRTYKRVIGYIVYDQKIGKDDITHLGWEYSGSDYEKNFKEDFGFLPTKTAGILKRKGFDYHNQTIYGFEMFLQLSYEKTFSDKFGDGIVAIIQKNWNYENKYTLHIFNDTGIFGIWTYGTHLLPKMEYDNIIDIVKDLSKVKEKEWKDLIEQNKLRMKDTFAKGFMETVSEIERFGKTKGKVPIEKRLLSQIKLDSKALKLMKTFRGKVK
jgi:hypothetical protein